MHTYDYTYGPVQPLLRPCASFSWLSTPKQKINFKMLCLSFRCMYWEPNKQPAAARHAAAHAKSAAEVFNLNASDSGMAGSKKPAEKILTLFEVLCVHWLVVLQFDQKNFKKSILTLCKWI